LQAAHFSLSQASLAALVRRCDPQLSRQLLAAALLSLWLADATRSSPTSSLLPRLIVALARRCDPQLSRQLLAAEAFFCQSAHGGCRLPVKRMALNLIARLFIHCMYLVGTRSKGEKNREHNKREELISPPNNTRTIKSNKTIQTHDTDTRMQKKVKQEACLAINYYPYPYPTLMSLGLLPAKKFTATPPFILALTWAVDTCDVLAFS
jgi:hypothetical protein